MNTQKSEECFNKEWKLKSVKNPWINNEYSKTSTMIE